MALLLQPCGFSSVLLFSVSKPYSVNSPRGPLPVGTANWSQIALTSTPSASSAASPLTQTPTLRQRLMEPPRLSLQHQLLHTGTSSVHFIIQIKDIMMLAKLK